MKTPDELRQFFRTCELLVVDMDGTCLDRTGTSSPATLPVLRAVQERGIVVVPASGRGTEGIGRALGTLEGFEYAISSNGALVSDLRTGEVLRAVHMERDVVADIVDEVMNESTIIHVIEVGEGAGQLRGCGGDEAKVDFGFKDPYRQRGGPERPPATPDLAQRVREGTPFVEKIGITFGVPVTFEQIEEVLERYPMVEGFRTARHIIEVSALGANKGAALAFLCGHLGIDSARACAIGDNGNDVSMFQTAGLGVAMRNAPERVQAQADCVTELDNDHEGAVRFLQTYALGD